MAFFFLLKVERKKIKDIKVIKVRKLQYTVNFMYVVHGMSLVMREMSLIIE